MPPATMLASSPTRSQAASHVLASIDLLEIGAHEAQVQVQLVGRRNIEGDLVRHAPYQVLGLNLGREGVVRGAQRTLQLVGAADDRRACLVPEVSAEEDANRLRRGDFCHERTLSLVELDAVRGDAANSGEAVVGCGYELERGTVVAEEEPLTLVESERSEVFHSGRKRRQRTGSVDVGNKETCRRPTGREAPSATVLTPRQD